MKNLLRKFSSSHFDSLINQVASERRSLFNIRLTFQKVNLSRNTKNMIYEKFLRDIFEEFSFQNISSYSRIFDENAMGCGEENIFANNSNSLKPVHWNLIVEKLLLFYFSLFKMNLEASRSEFILRFFLVFAPDDVFYWESLQSLLKAYARKGFDRRRRKLNLSCYLPLQNKRKKFKLSASFLRVSVVLGHDDEFYRL